jgi:hypothetical protein
MANWFATDAKKVGKVLEYPFVHAEQFIKTLSDALTDAPVVKNAMVGLLQQVEVVTADGAIAVAAKGIDLPDDVATVAAAQTLYQYVTNTFLPAVEKAYKDVAADVELTPATPVTPAPASEVIQGPGLHTITAD